MKQSKHEPKSQKEKGFYIRGAEEKGGDNRTGGPGQKSGSSQKTAKKSGGRQGMSKGKVLKKNEKARFASEESAAESEMEDIEKDQDDQS